MPHDPFYVLKSGPWSSVGGGVERRVMHLSGMSMVSFRLPKGMKVDRTHRHPQEQVAYVIEGRVRMTIGDEVKELAAGEGYLVPSGVTHFAEPLVDSLILDVFAPQRDDLPETG